MSATSDTIAKRRILMTGCSSGVGKTIRENLLEQGHEIYGVGKDGPNCFMDFEKNPPAISGDIINAAYLKSRVPDTIILNAGVTAIDFIEQHSLEAFERVLRCNLEFPFALAKSFVLFNESAGPTKNLKKIIFTGSMSDKLAMRGSPGYCASKAGLIALTKQMGKELAGRYGVYCIAPCTIENTEMSSYVVQRVQETRGMSREDAEKYCMQSPLGRAATHDEVWKMFDFVVNHAPEAATGSTFYMPAGMGI